MENQNMKKLWIGISIIVVVALAIVLVVTQTKKEPVAIKIGAILPLSGTYAQNGKYMQQGMEIALDDAIDKGLFGKRQVQIVFEDGQADPRKSVDAFYKLMNIDNIIAAVPATSAVILAIKPIANKDKIVLINATAISNDIEDAPDFLFSIIPDAAVEGKFLAEVAYQKLGKRNAGIIYRNDQSGKSFQESFSKRFKELGGIIALEEANQPNSNEFRGEITKLKSIDSLDIVFIASFGTETAFYLKQSLELGLKKQTITYETFNSPKNLEIASSAAEGIIFCSPIFDKDSSDPRIKELREKVFNKFNQTEFNFFIASHYDAAMLLFQAISKGNYDGVKIKNYISNLHEYNGVTGNILFNINGGAEVPISLYTVKDNKFIRFDQ
jgi:branched-chain amino acid transport system substrate-binding protein